MIEINTADTRRRELRAFIEKRDLKVKPWAKKAGVSNGTVRNFLKGISKTLTQATIEKLANAADATPAEIFPSLAQAKSKDYKEGVDKPLSSVASPNHRGVELLSGRHTTFTGPRDLPILGYVKAGELGFFIGNGERQGVTMRPEALRDVATAYAVRVHDESMKPRLWPGNGLFVDPTRPTKPGDLVIIQMTDGQAFVKVLTRRTERAWIFEQYNPAGEVRLDPKKVKGVHLVVNVSLIDI